MGFFVPKTVFMSETTVIRLRLVTFTQAGSFRTAPIQRPLPMFFDFFLFKMNIISSVLQSSQTAAFWSNNSIKCCQRAVVAGHIYVQVIWIIWNFIVFSANYSKFEFRSGSF